MEIGYRIKKAREDAGLSQTNLAKKIGVSKQTLYKYENNIITNIPLIKIEQISDVLNISASYLLGLDSFFSDYNEDTFRKLIIDLTNHTPENNASNESRINRVQAILNHFERLNVIGQLEAIKRVEELTYINKYINKDAKSDIKPSATE